MRKKLYQNRTMVYRYYRKFCNLHKRVSLLMRSGEFFDLSREIRHRLIRRLNLLFERIQRLAGKQKLRWAGAAMSLILSASVANAQFEDPVVLSGFNAGYLASPAFIDYDEDGDLDIVIGDYDGIIYYIQNDDGVYSRTINPFTDIDVGDFAMPALADLDEDGDLDLLVGSYYGTFLYFLNEGGTFTEQTGMDNPFNGVDLGNWSHPVFVNFDGDGDLDMVSGERYGEISYFENDGGAFTQLTGTDNPFDVVSIPDVYCTAPTFVDFDEDGDLDLFVGVYPGSVFYFRNIGGVFTEQTGANNPFNGVVLTYCPKPVFLDTDDDGDQDMVIADWYTRVLRYFRNDAGTFTEKRGTPNPFEGLLGIFGAAPAFSDVDNDGDIDVLISEKYGSHRFYERTEEGYELHFGDADPFSGALDTITSEFTKPAFADLDGDMDEDLLIGTGEGNLRYFTRQETGVFLELTSGDNPFNGIMAPWYVSPVFADLDEDSDPDLLIGSSPDSLGRISYFRNVSGNFTEQSGTDNPFDHIYTTDLLYGPLNPAFIDLDRDGDLDLFIGSKYGGNLIYYRNIEGTFTQVTGAENPFDGLYLGYDAFPRFVDIDGDGDLDLFVGTGNKYGDGRVFFFENNQGAPILVPQVPEEPKTLKIYSNGLTVVVDPGTSYLERVEVYSLSGQIMKQLDINRQGRYELDMAEAGTGLYVVRAYSAGVPTTTKVVLH